MTRHPRLLSLVLPLVLAVSMPAIEVTPVFANHAPADHGEVVYICDLDQHLLDLADWPVFVDALDNLKLRIFFEQQLGNRKASTQAILQAMRQARPFVPSEIALSAPASSYAGLGRVVRILGDMTIANGAEGQPSAEVGSDLVRLQDDALAQLHGFELPACRLWLSFAEEQTCTGMYGFIEAALLQQGEAWGVSRGADGELVFANTLGGILTALQVDDDAMRLFLASVGIASGMGDPKQPELIAAVRAIPLHATLRRLGGAMVLDLGTPPQKEDGSKTLADCRAGDGKVAIIHLSSRELAKVPAQMRELVEGFAGRPILARARERDREDLIGQMLRAERIMRESEERLDARVTIAGGGLRIESDLRGMPERPALAASGLADLVPAGCGMWWMDATRNPGEALRDTLIAFEDRLDSNSFVEALKSPATATTKQRILTAITTTLRVRLADLRSEILDHAPGRFGHGLVVVCAGGENLRKAVISIPATEPETTVDASGLPLPAIAVAGACPDPAAVLAHWRQLLRGTFGAQVEPLLADADLGLGVPTVRIDLQAAAALIPDVALQLDTGFQPHLAAIPGFLILSTSPALTKRIIEQRAKGNPVLAATLPAEALARGRIEPEAMARVRSGSGLWLERAPDLIQGRPDEDEQKRMLRNMTAQGVGYALDAYLQLCFLLPDVRVATDRGTGGWRTVIEMLPGPAVKREAPAPPKSRLGLKDLLP